MLPVVVAAWVARSEAMSALPDAPVVPHRPKLHRLRALRFRRRARPADARTVGCGQVGGPVPDARC